MKYAYVALLGWGFWAIGSKLITRYFNTLSMSFWITLWSFIFLILYIMFKRSLVINKYVWFSVPIGVISLVAILAFYEALRRGPASVVVPLTNMYVVFPVLFGFIILKEAVTPFRIIGIICAVLATVFLSL